MNLLANSQNLLPYDGEVYYLKDFLPEDRLTGYFDHLFNKIDWKNDEVWLFGKKITTARKTAWYGDQGLTYTYSKVSRTALTWTGGLSELKNKIEETTGQQFNACLLNLYHNGLEGVSWHSDNEKELGKNPVIASLSLGAERNFVFKHKLTKQKVALCLASGSLLVMKGTCQHHWVHALPKSKKVTQPRINLTFRKIITNI